MCKRIFCILLCMVMSMVLIPVNALGAEEPSDLHVKYDKVNQAITWDSFPNVVSYNVGIRNVGSTKNLLTISTSHETIDMEEILSENLSVNGLVNHTTAPGANAGFYVNPLTNDFGISGNYDICISVVYKTTDVFDGSVQKKKDTKTYSLNFDYVLENGYPGSVDGIRIIRNSSGNPILTWEDNRRDGGVKKNCNYKVNISFVVEGNTYFFNGNSVVKNDYDISTNKNEIDLTKLEAEFKSKGIENTKISVKIEACLSDVNYYKYSNSATATLCLNRLLSNQYSVASWREKDVSPYSFSYNLNGMDHTADFSLYKYRISLIKTISSSNHKTVYTQDAENYISQKTIDFSDKVVVNGSGIYAVLVEEIYKSGSNSGQVHSSYATWDRRYLFSDFVHFSKQNPENDAGLSCQVGEKLSISYSVAEIPSWMKNAGITVISPSVSIANSKHSVIDELSFGNGDARSWSGSWVIPKSVIGETVHISYNVYLKDKTGKSAVDYLQTNFVVNVASAPKLISPTPVMDPNGKVKWTSVKGATNYTIELKDRSLNRVTITSTTKTNCDLSSYMVDGKMYRCYVTANDTTGDHSKSDTARSEWVTYCTDEFYGIYIGGVPVTKRNRYDVLGDGSVEFLPNGEEYDEDLHGETLVLNGLNMKNAVYHTNLGGHRAMISIDRDISVYLIGENNINTGIWEDDLGGLDGIYIGTNDNVSFYGNGNLNISVSKNGNSAIYCCDSSIILYDDVTLNLSGFYGFNSDYTGIEAGYLDMYDNSKLYAYGYRDDNDKDGLAVYCPNITLYDNAYFYAEYEWSEQAVYTWDSSFTWNSPLNIRGIRIVPGSTYPEKNWETLKSINTTQSDDEGKFRALEIKAYKTGLNISGTVTSFGDSTKVTTIILKKKGTNAVAYAKNVVGNNTKYEILDVIPDTYIMTVSKADHTTREYTITVKDKSVVQNITLSLSKPDSNKGDVNGDGEVDELDSAIISRYSAGLADLTSAQQAAADVNNDGEIDELDSAIVSRYSAGLLSSLN